jgi:hypothetical protein
MGYKKRIGACVTNNISFSCLFMKISENRLYLFKLVTLHWKVRKGLLEAKWSLIGAIKRLIEKESKQHIQRQTKQIWWTFQTWIDFGNSLNEMSTGFILHTTLSFYWVFSKYFWFDINSWTFMKITYLCFLTNSWCIHKVHKWEMIPFWNSTIEKSTASSSSASYRSQTV